MKDLAVFVWCMVIIILTGGYYSLIIMGVMFLVMFIAFTTIPDLDQKIDRFNKKANRFLGLD